MLTLVRRARRRLYQNELLAHGANTGSAALLAFILLMLLGTQILNWEIALLIPLAAAGVGLYLARRYVPSAYATAQLIDRRLSLSDTLSTAYYFSESQPAQAPSAEVRALQFQRAEELAGTIDPRRAVPFRMPRGVYAMAVLAVIASSLFALRYGMTRRLDLQPPLARIFQDMFGAREQTQQAQNNPKSPRQDPGSFDENQSAQPDQEQEQAQKESDSGDGSNPNSESESAKAENGKGPESGKKDAEEGDKAEDGDQGGPGEEQAGNSGENSKSGQGDGKSDPKQDASAKSDANSSSENSGLMSKLKDFAQNLLSKMKPPNQSGGQQPSGEQKSQQSKGQQAGSKQPQAGKEGQPQNGQQGEPQEGQPGDQAEKSQDPDGKGNGKNDSQQSSKQPGSGVGSQDGDKKIRQAEQLAAIGKISEILGKRAATVTGEATVEVKSTSQQIRTPYAQRGVQHSQGGAQINRDEVPVALQPFVEHYFEQVRKQPAPGAASPAKK